jgi:hypothetical protein
MYSFVSTITGMYRTCSANDGTKIWMKRLRQLRYPGTVIELQGTLRQLLVTTMLTADAVCRRQYSGSGSFNASLAKIKRYRSR